MTRLNLVVGGGEQKGGGLRGLMWWWWWWWWWVDDGGDFGSAGKEWKKGTGGMEAGQHTLAEDYFDSGPHWTVFQRTGVLLWGEQMFVMGPVPLLQYWYATLGYL